MMGFHNKNSAICFLEIGPFPSQVIPGGMVIERVVVPWLTQPIGVIVSRPSDQPPDPLSWGRVRTLWYYIPADVDGRILECDTIVEEIHTLVRDFYRRVYDHRNAPRGTFIASGDDCEIVGKVVEWAGLTKKWEKNDLCDRHDFWKEVLMECDNVLINSNTWEGGGPGLSGVWFSVRSMNAKELRKEIAHWFEIMVERDKVEVAQAKLIAEEKAAEMKAKREARKKAKKGG